jgi:hypothetical protein
MPGSPRDLYYIKLQKLDEGENIGKEHMTVQALEVNE